MTKQFLTKLDRKLLSTNYLVQTTQYKLLSTNYLVQTQFI